VCEYCVTDAATKAKISTFATSHQTAFCRFTTYVLLRFDCVESAAAPSVSSILLLTFFKLSTIPIFTHPPQVSNIYHVPLILMQQNVHTLIKKALGLEMMAEQPDLSTWQR
jgi:hypothetical protein